MKLVPILGFSYSGFTESVPRKAITGNITRVKSGLTLSIHVLLVYSEFTWTWGKEFGLTKKYFLHTFSIVCNNLNFIHRQVKLSVFIDNIHQFIWAKDELNVSQIHWVIKIWNKLKAILTLSKGVGPTCWFSPPRWHWFPRKYLLVPYIHVISYCMKPENIHPGNQRHLIEANKINI